VGYTQTEVQKLLLMSAKPYKTVSNSNCGSLLATAVDLKNLTFVLEFSIEYKRPVSTAIDIVWSLSNNFVDTGSVITSSIVYSAFFNCEVARTYILPLYQPAIQQTLKYIYKQNHTTGSLVL